MEPENTIELPENTTEQVVPFSEENPVSPIGEALEPEGEDNDQPVRINFADDEELVKKARDIAETAYQHNRSNRYPYEEIWRIADAMYKCGQNSQIAERERQRYDRQASEADEAANMSLTKAQRKGSTLFFRQVRTLATQITSVLQSKPDPYKYTPIIGCESFVSENQAYDLAEQHNILNRWARKRDAFDKKAIELIFKLVKYGNYPVYVGWNRNSGRRLERIPVYGMATDETSDPPIIGWRFNDGIKIVNNEPTLIPIPIENFWADASVGDVQKQTCIAVDEYVPLSTIQTNEKINGFYLNTDKIKLADQWDGIRDDYQIEEQRSYSDGMVALQNRMNTGLFKVTNVFVSLPIDDSGKWVEDGTMSKWWMTFVGGIQNGVCVRMERNPDPDDEWPFRMLHALPDDDGKLYHFSYAQALRGDYDEQTTTRQQLIDNRTLQNNKPLKAIQGEVFVKDLRFGKDKVYWVENQNSVSEFQVIDIQQNGLSHLQYFDEDANRAAGTDKPLMGEYAGARTSASEASIVAQNASNPHIMLAKYILHDFLEFHASKSLKLWQIHGDNDQVLSITEKNIQRKINPGELFGEFDVEINLVDEFEQNALNIQTMTQAIQTLVPLFGDVIDKPTVARDVFNKIIKGVDVSRWIRPDANKDAIQLANHENRAMLDNGMVLSPNQGEDHETHLSQHEQERLRWKGAEESNPNVQILDRHIQMTKAYKQFEAQMASAQQQNMPNAMTGNRTVGQAVGNVMAGNMGAMQNMGAGQ